MATTGRGFTGNRNPDPRRCQSGSHQIRLPVTAFVAPDGEMLEHYDFVTGLILTPGAKELPDKVKTHWQGNVPRFHNLRWEGGEFSLAKP
jgi:hypothetical protein